MRQLRHTGIFVSNLEKMKEFYCNTFDMNVAVHDTEVGDYIANLYGMKETSIQVELYKLVTEDGCMIELLKIKPYTDKDEHSGQVFNIGCMHIAFTVTDVEEIYNKLVEKGLRFYSEPLLSRDGMHKVCFCRDLEGNFLELVQDL